MLGRASGVTFSLLLFLSALLGAVFLLGPCLSLAFFAPKAWRFVADRLVGYWLTFPASMIFFLFGVRVRVSGDLIRRSDPAVIIMNHRTRLDWMFFWNALYKMDPWLLTTEKISLKADLKKVPGAGWAMACGSYVFLNRDYSQDKKILESTLKYYKDTECNYQLLLFPEGTDRGERAVRVSHKYADENGLVRYNYLLHPRTTGFNFIINQMHKNDYLKYVYDVTVGYPKGVVASEMDLIKIGKFPSEVHFQVKRYDLADVVDSTEDGLDGSVWLKDLWQKKEEKLKRFYEVDHQFRENGLVWPGVGYYVAFSIWVFLVIFWMYWIWSSMLVKMYFVATCAFYVWAWKSRGGVEFLLMEWFYRSHLPSSQ